MFLNNKNIKLENKIAQLNNNLENVIVDLGLVNSQVEKLQQTIEDQIESMVGIDKWFNTENIHKDEVIIKTGGSNFRKTWALMDSKNILYIDDYPLLFEVLKAEDRGDGTFAMPDFYDGTLRHIRYGDSRELGTFETDAMQSHVHSNTHNHTANAHSHPINDIRGLFEVRNHKENYSSGAFYIENTGDGYGSCVGGQPNLGTIRHIFSSHRAGVTATNNTTSTINNTTITTDTGTGKSSNETRMKNTSGQWYILAKVTYFS